MMYYIDKPNTWRAANRKCAEMQEYVSRFCDCLITDDLSRDALVEELRRKTDELNEAYPRTRKLVTSVDFGYFITCKPEGSVDDYVFIIRINPVRKTYRFAEKGVLALEKGGRP